MARKKKQTSILDIDYRTKAAGRTTTPDGVPVFCAFDALIPVTELNPNPKNPNTHSTEQARVLGRIIKAAGWRQPIVVSTNSGMIVKGHGRRLAALNAGMTHVPVEYQTYETEAEETADLLADNKAAEYSMIDDKLLKEVLRDFDGATPVELTGFSSADVDALLQAFDAPAGADEDTIDDVPELQEQAFTQLGDVWTLGRHRLMCGSATDPATIDTLMRGERAQLVHTDPPYGVSYTSDRFDREMAGDDKRYDQLLTDLLQPAFRNMARVTDPDAAFYIWHASSTRREFEDALTAAGLIERQYIIWAKPAPVLGHADYQWAHEPCFYAGKAGERVTFYGDRTQRTVWKAVYKTSDGVATTLTGGIVISDGAGHSVYLNDKMPKGKKVRHIRLTEGKSITLYAEDAASDIWEVSRETKTIHATQKPIELVSRAIANSSRTGDLVLDLFAGSGSTLIACDLLGRRCYTTELEPLFCDRIIRRWAEQNECPLESIHGVRNGQDLVFADLSDGGDDDAFLA